MTAEALCCFTNDPSVGYDETMKLQRIAAWLVFAAIIIATLAPVDLRPHTDFPVSVERAAAYLVTGAVFALAYPRHIWWAVVFVLIATMGLEWVQEIRPDRHGRYVDAVEKLAGASVGLTLGWLAAQLIRRRQRI